MEVELRARIKNKEDIISRLTKLGAVRSGEKELTDYYFGDIGLYEKVGHSFWIRLRVEGDKVELAYKGSTSKDGIYEEYEQELQDLDIALAILTKMGLTNEITAKKKRISFKLDDISIEIDDFREWGIFIEAETISESDDKSKLYKLFEKLGISKEDVFEKGYITLMLEEKNSPFAKWIKN
jgi:adenylate cyclase class 2